MIGESPRRSWCTTKSACHTYKGDAESTEHVVTGRFLIGSELVAFKPAKLAKKKVTEDKWKLECLVSKWAQERKG